jgi:molybdate transport system substrate-binding protein
VKALKGGRLAVADTATVPAGRYAKEALMSLGVWKAAASHLAPAENVRVALAYVARGEAPLGIVYRTDALIEPAVRIVGTFPAASHKPIIYPAALIKGARPGTARFQAFLSSSVARTLFARSGFAVLTPASRH